jgi:transcriptional regulator with XRE-family HTH domain
MNKSEIDEREEDVTFSGVGPVIREHREKKKLTLAVVAERIGMNKSTLLRYETNETPLTGKMITKLAKAMRIKATGLMRDCLLHIRPKLKGSPFGQLLDDMINESRGESKG